MQWRKNDVMRQPLAIYNYLDTKLNDMMRLSEVR